MRARVRCSEDPHRPRRTAFARQDLFFKLWGSGRRRDRAAAASTRQSNKHTHTRVCGFQSKHKQHATEPRGTPVQRVDDQTPPVGQGRSAVQEHTCTQWVQWRCVDTPATMPPCCDKFIVTPIFKPRWGLTNPAASCWAPWARRANAKRGAAPSRLELPDTVWRMVGAGGVNTRAAPSLTKARASAWRMGEAAAVSKRTARRQP